MVINTTPTFVSHLTVGVLTSEDKIDSLLCEYPVLYENLLVFNSLCGMQAEK